MGNDEFSRRYIGSVYAMFGIHHFAFIIDNLLHTSIQKIS